MTCPIFRTVILLSQPQLKRPGFLYQPRLEFLAVKAPRSLSALISSGSSPIAATIHKRQTELIVPYRKYIRDRRFEDKRKLRRYRKRWKIERT